MSYIKRHLKGMGTMSGELGQYLIDDPHRVKETLNFVPQHDNSLRNRPAIEDTNIRVLPTDKVTQFQVNNRNYFAVYDTLLIHRWYRGPDLDLSDSSVNLSVTLDDSNVKPTNESYWEGIFRARRRDLWWVSANNILTRMDSARIRTIASDATDNYASLRRSLDIDSPFVTNSVEAIEYSNALALGSYFWDKPRYNFDYQASGRTFTTQDTVKQMLLDREKSSMWWQRFIIYNENGDPLTRYIIRPILTTENSGEEFNPSGSSLRPLIYSGMNLGPLASLGSVLTSGRPLSPETVFNQIRNDTRYSNLPAMVGSCPLLSVKKTIPFAPTDAS